MEYQRERRRLKHHIFIALVALWGVSTGTGCFGAPRCRGAAFHGCGQALEGCFRVVPDGCGSCLQGVEHGCGSCLHTVDHGCTACRQGIEDGCEACVDAGSGCCKTVQPCNPGATTKAGPDQIPVSQVVDIVAKEVKWETVPPSPPGIMVDSTSDLPYRNVSLEHRPQLFALLPDDEASFQRMYPAGGQLQDSVLPEISKLLQGSENARVFSPGEMLARQVLEQQINSLDPESPLVIFGHSKIVEGDRRMLVLPDGSEIPHDLVLSLCAARGRTCVLLTCHSESLDLDKITASLALKMWQNANAAIKGHQASYTLKDLADALIAPYYAERREHRIKVGLTMVAAGAGVGGVVHRYSPADREER